jgi:hypothetical protein
LLDDGRKGNAAIDGRTRLELHERLAHVLGPDAAATLMSYLPPVGWADVATKQDLTVLRRELGLRFDLTEERIRADLRGAMAAQTRTLVLALLAANATFGALAFAAARVA